MVECRGETVLIVRRSRPVAWIGPALVTNGKLVKEILRSIPHHEGWATELHELRAALRDRALALAG
jgi:L-lactate utilization protein LutB